MSTENPFNKGDRVRRKHEMGNRAFIVIAVARKKFHQSIDRWQDFNNLGKQIIKVRTVLSNGELGETWGWQNASNYELWTPQRQQRLRPSEEGPISTENPFKKGDRVRRTETGELGTVIAAVQVTEDQFTTRRVHGMGFHARNKQVRTAAKGDWKIGVHWDWEKERFGDKVPKVTDPEFAHITEKWRWHQQHKRWIVARFLEKVEEQS